MKLTLPVPVRKRTISPVSYRFDYEPREVQVIAVMRWRADSTGTRWYYHADFDHPDAHPEAVRIGHNKTLRTWIRRADHPRWKPPEFPAGSDFVRIPLEGGPA